MGFSLRNNFQSLSSPFLALIVPVDPVLAAARANKLDQLTLNYSSRLEDKDGVLLKTFAGEGLSHAVNFMTGGSGTNYTMTQLSVALCQSLRKGRLETARILHACKADMGFQGGRALTDALRSDDRATIRFAMDKFGDTSAKARIMAGIAVSEGRNNALEEVLARHPLILQERHESDALTNGQKLFIRASEKLNHGAMQILLKAGVTVSPDVETIVRGRLADQVLCFNRLQCRSVLAAFSHGDLSETSELYQRGEDGRARLCIQQPQPK